MHIIIDGYNMIRQSETLRRAEKQSLETGRTALIRLAVMYKKRKGHKLTVVFDGWQSGSPVEEHDYAAGVHIIYSRLGEKADDVIKRIAEAKSEEIVVVTSDREIVHFVEHRNGAAISPGAFEEKLYLLQGEGRSPAGGAKKDDESTESAERTGKKGPARRLSRRKKMDMARLKKI